MIIALIEKENMHFFSSPVRCRHCRCCSCRNLFTFSSSPLEPTKLGTKHPWVKGIQVCSNEGPRPFPRGDNYEIVKIH